MVLDGFESLRRLQLRLFFKKHADVATVIGFQRDRGLYLQGVDGEALLPSVNSSVTER